MVTTWARKLVYAGGARVASSEAQDVITSAISSVLGALALLALASLTLKVTERQWQWIFAVSRMVNFGTVLLFVINVTAEERSSAKQVQFLEFRIRLLINKSAYSTLKTLFAETGVSHVRVTVGATYLGASVPNGLPWILRAFRYSRTIILASSWRTRGGLWMP